MKDNMTNDLYIASMHVFRNNLLDYLPKVLLLGDQEKSRMPATLILFLSSKPKLGVSYTLKAPSFDIRPKYLSLCDHLKIGQCGAPCISALNERFFTPVLVSHMIIAFGSSVTLEGCALGENVTR